VTVLPERLATRNERRRLGEEMTDGVRLSAKKEGRRRWLAVARLRLGPA
jgi:hypothetical protein